MKKNILGILVGLMVIVCGVVLYRSYKSVFSLQPSDDQAALNQLVANQQNSSQSSQDQQDQQEQPQTDQVNNQTTQPNQNNQQSDMGLQIQTTQQGTGAAVKAGDTVSVKYTGKLTDGTVFDSTDKHGGAPFSFTVGAGQVIAGWDQGLIGMKVGEKRTLTIPGDLAYGAQGIPGVIPPNATLVFDIELVSIK